MTDARCREIATGFFDRLHSNDFLKEWTDLTKTEENVCRFIGRFASETIAPEDLARISVVLSAEIQREVEELWDGDARVPRHVGYACYIIHGKAVPV